MPIFNANAFTCRVLTLTEQSELEKKITFYYQSHLFILLDQYHSFMRKVKYQVFVEEKHFRKAELNYRSGKMFSKTTFDRK